MNEDAVEGPLQAFQSEFDTVMAGLAEMDKSETDGIETAHVTKTDIKALAPLVRELRKLLREASPQAMDLMPQLEGVIGSDHKDLLSDLRKKVHAFQFEEAISTLEELARKELQ